MDRKWDPILQAAKHLFLEKGVTATSMDEVAKRAGATKRTVYNNFGSKEKLLEAVFREAAAEFDENAPALAPNAREQELAQFAAKAIFALTHEYAIGFQRVMIAEGHNFPVLSSGLLKGAMSKLTAPLAGWLEKGGDASDVAQHKALRSLEELTAKPRLDRLTGARQPYGVHGGPALDEEDSRAAREFASKLKS
jgi:TetR/AcrR family transcriptional regulator, mexJK operon transcriptional repressor